MFYYLILTTILMDYNIVLHEVFYLLYNNIFLTKNHIFVVKRKTTVKF